MAMTFCSLCTEYANDYPEGGLYQALAHNACSIVANHLDDGFLSMTKNGLPVKSATNELLSPVVYTDNCHVIRLRS